MEYTVFWKIELEAESPEAAAKLAREIQLDKHSTATYFDVLDADTRLHGVDLGCSGETAKGRKDDGKDGP